MNVMTVPNAMPASATTAIVGRKPGGKRPERAGIPVRVDRRDADRQHEADRRVDGGDREQEVEAADADQLLADRRRERVRPSVETPKMPSAWRGDRPARARRPASTRR
jgi:hypothetical protein